MSPTSAPLRRLGHQNAPTAALRTGNRVLAAGPLARLVLEERLARALVANPALIQAATPKFGCLMAMLPSLDSRLPNWAADRIAQEDLAEDGIETEIHCTILYGFDLNFDAHQLATLLKPIALKLGKVERFECEEYDVLKIAVDSPDLIALHKRIAKEFKSEITSSKYTYHPHVTIAYVKKGACKELDGSVDFDGYKPHVSQMLYSLPEKKGRVVFNLTDVARGNQYRDIGEAIIHAQHAHDSSLSAKVAIFDADGAVLLLKDSRTDRWDLPGGHAHDGESPEEAARREVREETGLEVEPQQPTSRTYPDTGRGFIGYEAHVPNSKPAVTLSLEHSAYEWVMPDQAPLYALGPFAAMAAPTALGHAAVRDEARDSISRAVGRVLSRAESDALAGKDHDRDKDAFILFALAALGVAIASAYGRAHKRLARLARGEDRGDLATSAEEQAFADGRKPLLEPFVNDAWDELQAEAKRGQAAGEDETELHARMAQAAEKLGERGERVSSEESYVVYGNAQHRALQRAGYKTMHWVVADDDACEMCLENESRGQVEVGKKFPSGHEAPPAHPNCRCYLQGASRRGAVEASEPHFDPSELRDEKGRWKEEGIKTEADARRYAKEISAAIKRKKDERKQMEATGFKFVGNRYGGKETITMVVDPNGKVVRSLQLLHADETGGTDAILRKHEPRDMTDKERIKFEQWERDQKRSTQTTEPTGHFLRRPWESEGEWLMRAMREATVTAGEPFDESKHHRDYHGRFGEKPRTTFPTYRSHHSPAVRHELSRMFQSGSYFKRPVAGAVIVNDAGQVLMVHSGFSGQGWHFPKGGQDEGEHPAVASRREATEEAGFDPGEPAGPAIAIQHRERYGDSLGFGSPRMNGEGEQISQGAADALLAAAEVAGLDEVEFAEHRDKIFDDLARSSSVRWESDPTYRFFRVSGTPGHKTEETDEAEWMHPWEARELKDLHGHARELLHRPDFDATVVQLAKGAVQASEPHHKFHGNQWVKVAADAKQVMTNALAHFKEVQAGKAQKSHLTAEWLLKSRAAYKSVPVGHPDKDVLTHFGKKVMEEGLKVGVKYAGGGNVESFKFNPPTLVPAPEQPLPTPKPPKPVIRAAGVASPMTEGGVAESAKRVAKMAALIQGGGETKDAVLAVVDSGGAAKAALIKQLTTGAAADRAVKEYADTPTADLECLSAIEVRGEPVHGQANCNMGTRKVTMGSTSVTGDFRHELGHALHGALLKNQIVNAYIAKLHAEAMAKVKANPAGLAAKLTHEFYETTYGVIGRRALDDEKEDVAEHYRGYHKAVYQTRTGEVQGALEKYRERFPGWARLWDCWYSWQA